MTKTQVVVEDMPIVEESEVVVMDGKRDQCWQ